jgi:hemoglobin
MEKNIPTLYEWAGGKETLEKLTQLFYEKVAKDELLSGVFKNMSPHHSKHVAHFIGEVLNKIRVAMLLWYNIMWVKC